jgi:predicted Zn-dependent protease
LQCSLSTLQLCAIITYMHDAKRRKAVYELFLFVMLISICACSLLSEQGMRVDEMLMPSPLTLHGKPVIIKKNARDTESVRFYDYSSLKCTDLFSDKAREAAYPYFKRAGDFTRATDNDELTIGRVLEKNMQERFKGRLDTDREWVIYLNKLGKQLAKRATRKNVEYHLHVIEEEEINAFSIPWGGIYVYRGLIRTLKNEAQLAAIIAHEMQHVDLGHCVSVYNLLFKLPDKLRSEFTTNIAIFAAKLIKHPFNAAAETEADIKGMELIYSFGYSPHQYVIYWEKDLNEQAKKEPEIKQGIHAAIQRFKEEVENFAAGHPDDDRRACIMKRYLSRLCQKFPLETMYVGEKNLINKVTMFEKQY